MDTIKNFYGRTKAKRKLTVHEKAIKILINTANYANPKRTRRDIFAVFREFPQFKGGLKELNSCTRQKYQIQLTIRIYGELQVDYMGTTYAIPLEILLPPDYPKRGPDCYVRPSAGQQLRVSSLIDDKGRVLVPYLTTQWNRYTSKLIKALHCMQVVFGQVFPVCSATSEVNYDARAFKSVAALPSALTLDTNFYKNVLDGLERGSRMLTVLMQSPANKHLERTHEELKNTLGFFKALKVS